MSPKFKKTVLSNGVCILSEEHPYAHATASGIWVKAGTRDERESQMGISHFLEHMVFKGTKKRSAFELARALESVGGEMNAYTTREYTCYHALSLPEHGTLALDVLADLVSHATFPKNEVELERNVILQEIAAAEEAYEELLYDLFFENYFGASSLGFSILGNELTVNAITRSQLIDYYQKKYAGSQLIVTVTGRLDHDEVVQKVEEALGKTKARMRGNVRKKPKIRPFRQIVTRECDQVYILVGIPAPSFKDAFRFEAFIVNALLGGGMTSKLYQNIREKKGLVYSIYSSLNTFTDTGVILVYAGASVHNYKKVLSMIMAELDRTQNRGISESDLNLFKTQVRGSILLGSDDLENRMNSLGVNEMVFGAYRPVDEIINEIQQVNSKSVRDYIEKKLDLSKLGILLIGPDEIEKDRKWLQGLSV